MSVRAMIDRWEWNGPEEGDEMDLTVVVMCDGNEIMEIDGTMEDLGERKKRAKVICKLLNEAEWDPLV